MHNSSPFMISIGRNAFSIGHESRKKLNRKNQFISIDMSISDGARSNAVLSPLVDIAKITKIDGVRAKGQSKP